MVRDLEALLGFLAERQPMPFAWGRRANDCVGFVLDAVRAQTGWNVLPRVSWPDERGAVRTIARLGGLEHAFDARMRRVSPADALRGDVGAIVDERFGISLTIVEGATLAGPGQRGIKRLPRAAMIAAWSAERP